MINLYQRAFFNARHHYQESFRQFATRLGVAHSMIARIEQGKQTPSPQMIKRLEEATGCAFPDLVQGVFDPKPNDDK